MTSLRLHAFYRSSASWRVRIALHLKGVAHEIVPVALGRSPDSEQFSEAYRRHNPLGQVPALEIGGGRAIAQSMAILEYLEEAFPEPPLLPSDPYLRARARMLAEIVNAGIQPLQNNRTSQRVSDLGGDETAWNRRWIDEGLTAMQTAARPTSGRFLVGDTATFADICLVPQLHNARRAGCDLDAWPLLMRVEARCTELDAFEDARPEHQPDFDPSGGVVR